MTNEPIPRLLVPSPLPRRLLRPGDHIRLNGRTVVVDTVTALSGRTRLTVQSTKTGRLVQPPPPSAALVRNTALRTDEHRPEVLAGGMWADYWPGHGAPSSLGVPLARGVRAILEPQFELRQYVPAEQSLFKLNVHFPGTGDYGVLAWSNRGNGSHPAVMPAKLWADIAQRMRMLHAFGGGLTAAGEAVLKFSDGRPDSPSSDLGAMWAAAVAADGGRTLDGIATTFLLRFAPHWDGTARDLLDATYAAFDQFAA